MKIDEITVKELFYTKKDYKKKDRDLKLNEYGGEESFEVDVDGEIFRYHSWEDQDDDVSKIFHFVTPPGGEEVSFDWSPYENPTNKDVHLWIKLGMPQRQDLGLRGPIRQSDLVNYARSKGMQLK